MMMKDGQVNTIMIDLKELAEANRHCRDNHNCIGCPFKNKDECRSRESLNNEMVIEFLDMIGFDKTQK